MHSGNLALHKVTLSLGRVSSGLYPVEPSPFSLCCGCRLKDEKMIVFRGRVLWISIFLLAFVLSARCSYLYDECTVQDARSGLEIKTFGDSLRVTIANSDEDNDVTIGIKGKEKPKTLEIKKKWMEVECRVSGDEEIECGEEKSSTTESNSGGLAREFEIRNAEVLANCPQGLPNKELPPSTTVKFPRWNSTKEHFAVIPEVDLTVVLSIFGEDLVLCWDGNQAAVKASEGDCQGLPAREVHKVTLDYETQEIKSADGRVLRRLNSTNANKDDLMKMKADGGKAWAVQSLGDWPHPQDQDQSTDNQVEWTCNNGGTSGVILIVLLVLFIITTIVLAVYILRLRINSRTPSASSRELTLNTARETMVSKHPHRRDSGVETINDIYGFDD
ncbi:uncharacterized protein [Penaeus vannamei]|uniref:uncharacterized protein n=1 Tax=Penaeus vannamei TaxID=6689 RepID=UPI00387FA243